MLTINVLLVIVGLLTIGYGFWASYNVKRPFDIIGAVLTPIGLMITLIGVLLICVPGFFSS